MTLSDGSLSAGGSLKVTVRKEGTGGTTPGFEALLGVAALGVALVLWGRRR
jgi:PGF-CTERM protein